MSVTPGGGPPLAENTPASQPVAAATNPIKRKSSLDDFESEIEALNLDDNIDTSVSNPLSYIKYFPSFDTNLIPNRLPIRKKKTGCKYRR